MRHLGLIVGVAWFATACGGLDLVRQDDNQAKADDEKRPGDESEGMVGYLVDPELIAVYEEEDGKTVALAAPEGTVTAVGGDPAAISVRIWTLPAADLGRFTGAASAPGDIAATLVATVVPRADGSFAAQVTRSGNDPFIVDVSTKDAAAALTFNRNASGAVDAVVLDWRNQGATAGADAANPYLITGCVGKRLTTALARTGAGTAANPFKVCSLAQLDEVRASPAAHFSLESDIDASPTAKWDDTDDDNDVAGFKPLGWDSDNAVIGVFDGTAFTGIFDGRGHTITGLAIGRASEDFVGLFGRLGDGAVVKDLALADVSITGRSLVGAVAGQVDAGATVTGVEVRSGKVQSQHTAAISLALGGAVGSNSGSLSGVSVGAKVANIGIPGKEIGGIAGINSGAIDKATFTGTLSAAGSLKIGGVAGLNTGAITASGYVSGGGNPSACAGDGGGTTSGCEALAP